MVLTVNATAQIDVREFPFVAEMPRGERNELQKLWDELQEVKARVKEKGMLLPVSMAAGLGGVSRQRIHQLCEDGRLERVEIGKGSFVTEHSLTVWVESERKAGRPFSHVPETLVGQLKFSANLALEARREDAARRKASRKK